MIEPSRKAALEAARVRAIVRDRFDHDLEPAEVLTVPFGVVARDRDRAWIVSSSPDLAVLGGALIWAARARVDRVDFIVEHHAGMHSRRVRMLAPDWTVWLLDGADVSATEIEPLIEPAPRADGLDSFAVLIEQAGAAVVHEDGIMRAEVCGLEVGRVVFGPDGAVFESGVGRFDREAGVLLNAGRDPAESLAAVVAQVEPHRRVGAEAHPIGRLSRARWLRTLVLETPSIAGVVDPEIIDPIPARFTLLDEAPAALLGKDAALLEGDNSPLVLVVCTVGVDLGLVPELADLVERHAPDEVRIVMPTRDRLPSVEALVARLSVPVDFCDIVTPWAGGVSR